MGLLLSTSVFEAFYGRDLGLDVEEYLDTYRNDWSWEYLRLLRGVGVEGTIYVSSMETQGLRITRDGYRVRFLRVGRAFRRWQRLPTARRSSAWRYVNGVVNGAALLRPLRRAVVEDGLNLLAVQEYWAGRFDVLAHGLRDIPVIPRTTECPTAARCGCSRAGPFAGCVP